MDRLTLRMLAPAALGLFALALLIVIVVSLGDGDSGTDSERGREGTPGRTQTTPERRSTGSSANRRVYVVRPGDTLAKIAEETDVPIERLIALNPSVDPQGLVTGQRIKLRE